MLITANHVLDGIQGSNATIFLRVTNESGRYIKMASPISIRNGLGAPLWVRHPKADVAGIIAPLPGEFLRQHEWITADFLSGDDKFKRADLRPGDELMCLGYPLGLEGNEAGFPILRSGRIASYPVAPAAAAPTFLFDMTVYGGNSGGPVFFDFRKRDIPGLPPEQWLDAVGIAGLVSQDINRTEYSESYFETTTRRTPLGLAVVVPAEFVIQTIDLLNETPPATNAVACPQTVSTNR